MTASTHEAKGCHLSFDHVTHGFVQNDDVVFAIDDVCLNIPAGQFVALVGPSGCGKTTMLNMIAGVLSPTEGSLTIDGGPPSSTATTAAYMLARDALLPWRSALENVELGLLVRGVRKRERRARARQWLARVHLSGFEDARPTQLSHGMCQRVAIARTLALDPKVILMDEPFAALDAQTRVLVQEEFLSLWEREGQTVVLVTHDLGEAILLSDRVVLLSQRPCRIVSDITVPLPRPRNPERDRIDPRFSELHRQLWEQLRQEVVEPQALGDLVAP